MDKKWYKWTCVQTKNSVTDVRKQPYGYQVGKGGGDKLGGWV